MISRRLRAAERRPPTRCSTRRVGGRPRVRPRAARGAGRRARRAAHRGARGGGGGRAGARGRGRRRPLHVHPRARARDALRAPEREPARAPAPAHRRGAGGAGRLGATPAELAHHFFEGRHSTARARRSSTRRRPAEQAAAALAYEEAAEHYRRALERATSTTSGAATLLLALGAAEGARATRRRARRSLRAARARARASGLPEQLAEAALGFAGRYAEAGAIDHEGIALLEEALERARRADTRSRSSCCARLADRLHFAGEAERVDDAQRPRRWRWRGGSATRAALVAALESRHAALLHIDHLDERLAAQRGAARARRADRRARARGARAALAHLRPARGRRRARRARAPTASRTLAAELRQPLYRYFAVALGAVWAQIDGRVDEVEAPDRAHARVRPASRQCPRPTSRRWASGSRSPTASARSAPTPRCCRRDRAEPAPEHLPPGARARLAAGRRSRRRRRAVRAARRLRGRAARHALVERDRVLAEVCALIGDTRRAETLYGLLLPYRHRIVVVGMASCFGSCERYLGLLARARSRLGRGGRALRGRARRQLRGRHRLDAADGPRRLHRVARRAR